MRLSYARNVLVRELADTCPEGWPPALVDANRFQVAMALDHWSAYSPLTHEERVRQASAALLATPPPAGWRPLSHDDERLFTLLPDDTA